MQTNRLQTCNSRVGMLNGQMQEQNITRANAFHIQSYKLILSQNHLPSTSSIITSIQKLQEVVAVALSHLVFLRFIKLQENLQEHKQIVSTMHHGRQPTRINKHFSPFYQKQHCVGHHLLCRGQGTKDGRSRNQHDNETIWKRFK